MKRIMRNGINSIMSKIITEEMLFDTQMKAIMKQVEDEYISEQDANADYMASLDEFVFDNLDWFGKICYELIDNYYGGIDSAYEKLAQ